jgi:hypothetical protein
MSEYGRGYAEGIVFQDLESGLAYSCPGIERNNAGNETYYRH